MAFPDWLRKVLEIGPKNEPAPDNTSDPIPHPDPQAIASSRNGNQGVRQDPQKRQRFIDLFHENRTYGDIGVAFGVSAARVGQTALRLWRDGELTGYPRNRDRREFMSKPVGPESRLRALQVPDLKLTCEDCGKDFLGKRPRPWGTHCHDCAAERRKVGRGPFQ